MMYEQAMASICYSRNGYVGYGYASSIATLRVFIKMFISVELYDLQGIRIS